jgi:hypothetical protein
MKEKIEEIRILRNQKKLVKRNSPTSIIQRNCPGSYWDKLFMW